MRKRRSNLNLVVQGGLVALTLLLPVLSGCKKKEPVPPPPAQVQPLPSKPVQANMSASKHAQVKPAGNVAAPANAKSGGASGPAATTPPAQAKPAVSPAGQLPVKQDIAQAKTPTDKPGIQKQVTSARISLPPAAINLDFTNRRDPFKPFIQAPVTKQAGSGKDSRMVKDALPIQNFATENFRISGIITGIKENSALVIDPKGKGYVVREGMLIGNNEGRIKRITNSTIEVEEKFRDDNGRVKKRLVKLALTRKK